MSTIPQASPGLVRLGAGTALIALMAAACPATALTSPPQSATESSQVEPQAGAETPPSGTETGSVSQAAAGARAPNPPTGAYPAKGVGVSPVVAGYSEARWAENWSALRDPSRRDHPLENLKYIPLSADGEIWLSLSGEMRVRTDYTTSPGLEDAADERLDTLRLMGGADLRIGKHVRVFGELAHGSASGKNIGDPVGVVRNDLLVSQAFVDVQGEVGGLEVGARYGRQFFTDGTPYLISTRNGATVLTPFTGTRAWVRSSNWRADVFDFNFVSLGNEGWSDDRTNEARRFKGINTSFVLPKSWTGGGELFVDPFFWRYENDARRWGASLERESRDYAGARIWGQAHGVTIDWAVARQTGSFGERDIDALHVFTQQSLSLGDGAAAPKVGLRMDYASGGGSYDDGPMRNAVTPYGVPIFYSYQLALSPVNLVAIAPNISVKRGPTTVTAELQGTWRASRRDAVYRNTDLPYAGTQVGQARRIGEVWRLQVAHVLSERASLLARYEHLAAGPALTDAGYESSDHFIAWVNYRF